MKKRALFQCLVGVPNNPMRSGSYRGHTKSRRKIRAVALTCDIPPLAIAARAPDLPSRNGEPGTEFIARAGLWIEVVSAAFVPIWDLTRPARGPQPPRRKIAGQRWGFRRGIADEQACSISANAEGMAGQARSRRGSFPDRGASRVGQTENRARPVIWFGGACGQIAASS